MKVTTKQLNVLDNLHRITTRRVGNRMAHFLDGDDCRTQLNSLGAKGLLRRDGMKLEKIADPTGTEQRAGKTGL